MNFVTTTRLALVASDHPALRTISSAVRPEELEEILNLKFQYQLHKLMKAQGGVGLAANQVGDTRRYFAWKWGMVINPAMTPVTGRSEVDEEGCLSFPGARVLVPRFDVITVAFIDESGRQTTTQLDGFKARVFQHEFDHLNGICIVQKGPLTGMLQSAA